VREYLALVAEQTGAKIFFVDEAHFRADGDLRGLWVCKGTPALVDSTSPGGVRRPATTRRSKALSVSSLKIFIASHSMMHSCLPLSKYYEG
jgi:hypothetical protein